MKRHTLSTRETKLDALPAGAFRRRAIAAGAASGLLAAVICATATAATPVQELAERLRAMEARVVVRGEVRQPPLVGMLGRDVDARLRAANRADRLAWEKVEDRAAWEQFRNRRLDALRASLGQFPSPPADLGLRITGRHEGDGYELWNLVYRTRPGLLVTANLYRPARGAAVGAAVGAAAADWPKKSLPAVVVCHSHQSTKHNGWRQDMAMTWARAGCVVLVADHLGHGERRQHPFGEDGPHDYHFRYEAGMQLHLVGESLIGWMVWDMMRGVDLLLGRPEVDPKRIVLISEPAGGGDVAAVVAALDPRIAGAMIQNFGGPEPETAYPLPKDVDESFDYAGVGSWESTRNLRLSARDGFLPWVIVASGAPRRLIYDHEFYWDRDHDPVWKRLRRVHAFYGAGDTLTGVAGKGFVVGSKPENSHWLPGNREQLYPLLERWFAIPNPGREFSRPRPVADLTCLTPDLQRELGGRPLYELAMRLGDERIAAARRERAALSIAERRAALRRDWTRLLGSIEPASEFWEIGDSPENERIGEIVVERHHWLLEPGIVAPTLLLLPPANARRAASSGTALPVVVGVAQQGKQAMLRERSQTIAELLLDGVAVCLPDLRGTGETRPSESRGRRSIDTDLASSEWMLGESLLGGRLRDLRCVVGHLRKRPEIDRTRIALWGDSFAPVNLEETNFAAPHTASERPAQSEPLGGLLATLGALFEDDVRAVYARRGLSDYRSALASPFCYLPHDAIVPGVLTTGDLADVAAALAPRDVWIAEPVDGLNRASSAGELARIYEPARAAYAGAGAENRFKLSTTTDEPTAAASWLLESLSRGSDASRRRGAATEAGQGSRLVHVE